MNIEMTPRKKSVNKRVDGCKSYSGESTGTVPSNVRRILRGTGIALSNGIS